MALPDGQFKEGQVRSFPRVVKLPRRQTGWYGKRTPIGHSPVASAYVGQTVVAYGQGHNRGAVERVQVGDVWITATQGLNESGEDATAVSFSQGDVYAAAVLYELTDEEQPAAGELFDIRPNWANGVTEIFQWRTDYQRGMTGREFRRSIYQGPRRGFRYQVVTTDVPKLDAYLSGLQDGVFIIPRWPSPTPLPSAVTAGQLELVIDPATNEWVEGGLVMVLGDPIEVLTITAVHPDHLEFHMPFQADHPEGTLLFPARVTRLQQEFALARDTAGIITGELEFLADQDTKPGYAGVDSTVTFNYHAFDSSAIGEDEPVYLQAPNRARPADVTYARDATVADSVGRRLIDDPEGDPEPRHRWEYLFSSRDEIDDFLRWMHAREGRLMAFWYPTWSADYQVADTIQVDTAELIVRPINWQRYYSGRAHRDVVAIQDAAGTWYFARVEGASIVGQQETLALDRPLIAAGGVPLAAADVRRACWLERVRLSADRLELTWLTRQAAQTGLAMRAVKP